MDTQARQAEAFNGNPGLVVDVRLVSGSDPFAAVAQRAALTWKFSPAVRERAGTSVHVAARIRVDIAFIPPKTLEVPDVVATEREEVGEPDIEVSDSLESSVTRTTLRSNQ